MSLKSRKLIRSSAHSSALLLTIAIAFLFANSITFQSSNAKSTFASVYAEDVKMTVLDECHLLFWKVGLASEPPMNYVIELIDDSVDVSDFGETE